jgi:hypothetical protein
MIKGHTQRTLSVSSLIAVHDHQGSAHTDSRR